MHRKAYVCIHTIIHMCEYTHTHTHIYIYIYIYIYLHSISNICSSRNMKKQSKLSYVEVGMV